MMRAFVFLCLSMLGVATPASAETLAFTHATIHTQGAAGSLEDATLIVQDGRVLAVGKMLEIPKAATIIDARGKVITPGLFEAAGYLGIVEISMVEESVDNALNGDAHSAAFDVADAINPESTLIAVNRIEGITRAMVAPQSDTHLFAGKGAVMHLGGGEDYLTQRDAAVFVTLGEHGARIAGGARGGAFLQLREALLDARDHMQHRAEFERGARYDYALNRFDLDALSLVLRREAPLVVQVERASDIEAVLRLADEFKLRLVIAGGTEAWQVADKIAKAEVPVIIDPTQNLPRRFETLGATLHNAARLHEAGVRIAFADYDSHNARNLTQLAGNAVAYGLPWQAALAAVTRAPAEIWGLGDRLGTLEPGKEADLVIWDGDPLEVTSFADQVYIRGKAVPMVSRQTLLRDRYWDLDRDLPPAYYQP